MPFDLCKAVGRLVLPLCFAGALAGAAQAQDACAIDRAAALSLSVEAFEGEHGWRQLGERRPGCEAKAADLIRDYRTANAATLVHGEPSRLQNLFWHEGQLRAAAGDYKGAVELIRRGRVPDDAAGAAYGEATLAFLQRDRAALVKARERLAKTVQPDWFADAARRFKEQHGQTLTWPPALDVVEGLLACFDKPYAEAYGPVCRPKRAQPGR